MNPCDPCVFNKMVNGSQLTAAFHVDDMKESHEDPKVVDGMIKPHCRNSQLEAGGFKVINLKVSEKGDDCVASAHFSWTIFRCDRSFRFDQKFRVSENLFCEGQK